MNVTQVGYNNNSQTFGMAVKGIDSKEVVSYLAEQMYPSEKDSLLKALPKINKISNARKKNVHFVIVKHEDPFWGGYGPEDGLGIYATSSVSSETKMINKLLNFFFKKNTLPSVSETNINCILFNTGLVHVKDYVKAAKEAMDNLDLAMISHDNYVKSQKNAAISAEIKKALGK